MCLRIFVLGDSALENGIVQNKETHPYLLIGHSYKFRFLYTGITFQLSFFILETYLKSPLCIFFFDMKSIVAKCKSSKIESENLEHCFGRNKEYQ